jgi:hypothetical protein
VEADTKFEPRPFASFTEATGTQQTFDSFDVSNVPIFSSLEDEAIAQPKVKLPSPSSCAKLPRMANPMGSILPEPVVACTASEIDLSPIMNCTFSINLSPWAEIRYVFATDEGVIKNGVEFFDRSESSAGQDELSYSDLENIDEIDQYLEQGQDLTTKELIYDNTFGTKTYTALNPAVFDFGPFSTTPAISLKALRNPPVLSPETINSVPLLARGDTTPLAGNDVMTTTQEAPKDKAKIQEWVKDESAKPSGTVTVNPGPFQVQLTLPAVSKSGSMWQSMWASKTDGDNAPRLEPPKAAPVMPKVSTPAPMGAKTPAATQAPTKLKASTAPPAAPPAQATAPAKSLKPSSQLLRRTLATSFDLSSQLLAATSAQSFPSSSELLAATSAQSFPSSSERLETDSMNNSKWSTDTLSKAETAATSSSDSQRAPRRQTSLISDPYTRPRRRHGIQDRGPSGQNSGNQVNDTPQNGDWVTGGNGRHVGGY